MTAKKISTKQNVAVILVNNEIVLASLKKVLESMGYDVRQDIDSTLDAKFAVVGAYFAYLGIIKQLRATNPLLPIVVIETSDYKLNGALASIKEIYDVISIDNQNESKIEHKIKEWFQKGNGKCLLEK